MTRRWFLGLAAKLGALLAAVAAAPAALYWWRSSRLPAPGSGEWVALGPARKVPEGEWIARRFAFERSNRWRHETVEELVYVWREGREITVLSPVCPHARCLVRQTDEGFTCPCHRSAFDSEGGVLYGPSPRPLDKLEWRVRKGVLQAHYRTFPAGEAAPEADEA